MVSMCWECSIFIGKVTLSSGDRSKLANNEIAMKCSCNQLTNQPTIHSVNLWTDEI